MVLLFRGLIISLFFISAISSYAYFEVGQERSQDAIIAELHHIPPSIDTYFDPSTKIGPISSGISFIMAGSSQKLEERGFKTYAIQNEEGYQTTAIIKIQKGGPRPTVIFIAGLGAKADTKSLLHYALPLDRYLGWNVILLENSANTAWIHKNDSIITSGYEAGWMLYLNLKALRSHPQVGPFISELHAVGSSLGGNDLAHALYFDSLFKSRLVDGGAMNWSSPADRYEGFKRIRSKGGVSGVAATYMMQNVYDDQTFRRYTDKGFWWIFRGAHFDDAINEVFGKASNEYFRRHPHHFAPLLDGASKLKLEVEGPLSLVQIKSLYKLDRYIKDIHVPLLWIHSWDDPIVDYDITISTLIHLALPPEMGLMTLNNGGHVGFSHSYGGEWVAEVMVNYFEYWGNFPKSYYEQWRKPYQKQLKYLRYLRRQNLASNS